MKTGIVFLMDPTICVSRLLVILWNDYCIPLILCRLLTFVMKGRVEEIVDGLLSIQSNLESECISTYNPVVDLPTGAITSDIRQLSLPSMSSLGTIEKTLIQTTEEFYFGEAFYLQNDISTSGCSSISPNGIYANILGTLASGEQVWYAAHVETDENTLDNPVTDAGAAMTNIAELLGANDVDENYSVSACPVPSRSFVNGEF